MDQDKCIYMASFFEEGAAKQWYISVHISQTHLLYSFEDFHNKFQAHFSNPNIATSAKYKIDALSQTGSVASYAVHYFELLIHVDWSEQTKINTFYRKLKLMVKDIISYTLVDKHLKTFKKYIGFCIDIDNHVHEWEVKHCHETKPTNAVKSSNPSCNTNNSSFSPHIPLTSLSSSSTLHPGEPMEIDVMKTGKPCGPLTPEEHQHCKDLKLISIVVVPTMMPSHALTCQKLPKSAS